MIKALYWFTRILAILAILFLLMFSFDVFSGNEPFLKQLGGFIISNIPVIALIVVLIYSWKHELIGGILFIVVFILMAIRFGSFTNNSASLMVISPFLFIGILFMLHHFLTRQKEA